MSEPPGLTAHAPLPPDEQRKVVSGLQVGIFVAAIDSTLVSVALLTIARDLGGASLIAWVVAGYTVAATVATPVYGSLSDIHGRQRMMTIAIVIYLIAAIGCLFAQSMPQLLALRVLQGLGGGGLVVLSQSTIGDVVPPTERGRYQAWLSGTYALAALIGPVTGGYLTIWFGWRSVFAVTAALREVEVNRGRGQVVDLSLLEPMLSIMGPDVTHYAATGVAAEPGKKISSPRGAYRCRDGRWVSMSGSSDTMARRVFDAIGQGALFDDQRFSTNAARLAHDDEIERMVAEFIAGMDQAACLAWFRGQGVTVGPIYDAAQLLQDPHVAERGVYLQVADAGQPATVMHNITPRLSGTPGGLRRSAPRRGEHTAQLLAELGADAEEIRRLSEQGSIECG